ncbi:cupin-like domain-containing protein [Mycena rebaudengoi]|nr:cupin-like domain-containing protein [Mycena rebaudengoi]
MSKLNSESNVFEWLSSEYHDLNGTHVEVLDEPPTALDFSRIVHISRPVIIREISVAVTPNGRADAVTRAPNGELFFVEPYVEKMKMSEFLFTKLSGKAESETHYLQSQNGNVLRPDIPKEIPWCSDAFGKPPDAVNLWIGSSSSETSIHSDPYENIYTVVRGAKHFTLLPPTEGWRLQERMYPHATWTRKAPNAALTLSPSTDLPAIRWSSVTDPHLPGGLPPGSLPIHITIHAGETLYLPAGWWHHVQQADRTIALNWWYDMEMRGISWILLSFLRGAGEVPPGNETTCEDERTQ